MAIKNSARVRALAAERNAQDNHKKSLQGSLLPSIGVTIGTEHQMSDRSASSDHQFGYLYSNYNLFNGFREDAFSKEASKQQEFMTMRLESRKYQIRLDVEEAFQRCIYYNELIQLKSQLIKLNLSHKRSAKKRQKAGFVSRADILEFDLRNDILRAELNALEHKKNSAIVSLAALLSEVEDPKKLIPQGDLLRQKVLGSLTEYLAVVKENSPSIRAAQIHIDIARLGIRKSQSAYYPKVDFALRVGDLPRDIEPSNSQTDHEDPSRLHSNFLLTATWEFFSGRSTHYDVGAKHKLLEATQENFHASMIESMGLAKKHFQILKSIEEQLDLEEKNVRKSKELYQIVSDEYRKGVKGSSDLASAAQLSYQTLVNRMELKHRFIQERIELERLTERPIRIVEVADTSYSDQ